MSAAGTQLRRERRTEATGDDSAKSRKRRSPLAFLLHALNQPLTGLQCSLEVAVSAPRAPEEYARTIAEGIELTNRMRALVDAMREVIDIGESTILRSRPFALRSVLVDLVDELRPVAESGGLRLKVECEPGISLMYDKQFFRGVIFRLVDTLLGQSRTNGAIDIMVRQIEGETQLEIQWDEESREADSAFSRAELGFLLVEAGCERLGARWERGCCGGRSRGTMTFPSVPAKTAADPSREDRR
jgi:signal transduction histidine kinase